MKNSPPLPAILLTLSLLLSCVPPGRAATVPAVEVIDIGGRRELLVDDHLIARKTGLELKLHEPTAREIVMIRDKPWEGSGSDFETIFRDGEIIRMYYMGMELTSADGLRLRDNPGHPGRRDAVVCYAESKDGRHWTRPDLGLFDFNGSKHNNILWDAPNLDNFVPFKDPNPDCPPDELYKAVSSGRGGLVALKSADGIHWDYLQPEPIITRGKFDTQNNAFWDPIRKIYWCYIRDFHGPDGKPTTDTKTGIRDILFATSKDFRNWSEPRPLDYGDSPDEALYVNGVRPYARAPHIFIGFPARYIDRPYSAAALRDLPDAEHRRARMKFSPRYGTVLSDTAFMTSRDGHTFHRWGEAFIRPGPERRDGWVYGDGFVAIGLLETPAEDPTAARELTLYTHDDHWKGPTRLRRNTIRIDGFVSLHAKRSPGEWVSKPIQFTGSHLTLNFATSAGGSIRIELLDQAGQPLSGYSLAECDELFGDTLDRTVSWQDRSDLSALAGQPIRLRMVISDADLYSLQFQP